MTKHFVIVYGYSIHSLFRSMSFSVFIFYKIIDWKNLEDRYRQLDGKINLSVFLCLLLVFHLLSSFLQRLCEVRET
jgi:hypothetical protein